MEKELCKDGACWNRGDDTECEHAIPARLKEVAEAMEYTGEKPADPTTRADIYIISEKCAPNVKDILMRLIYKENIGGASDLSYQIVADACALVGEVEPDNIELAEFYGSDCASVYTSERLGYLNNNNQHEISEKQREYDCDIADACAAWYEDMVVQAAEELLDYVKGN